MVMKRKTERKVSKQVKLKEVKPTEVYEALGIKLLEFVIEDHMDRTKYNLLKAMRDESFYRAIDAKAHTQGSTHSHSDELVNEVAENLLQAEVKISEAKLKPEVKASPATVDALVGQVGELSSILQKLNQMNTKSPNA